MNWKHCLAAAGLALVALSASAQRADTLVVDGDDWMSATSSERRAFLVGAANMIIAEDAYAKRRKLAPAPAGAQITKGVGNLKLADIEARITRHYEANPGQRSSPVMGVIWREFVKGKQ